MWADHSKCDVSNDCLAIIVVCETVGDSERVHGTCIFGVQRFIDLLSRSRLWFEYCCDSIHNSHLGLSRSRNKSSRRTCESAQRKHTEAPSFSYIHLTPHFTMQQPADTMRLRIEFT